MKVIHRVQNTTSTFFNRRLFISDGTVDGTFALDPSTNTYLQPRGLTSYHNLVYFTGAYLGVTFGLFRTQGTLETTVQAIDHSAFGPGDFGSSYITVFNDSLFFEGGLLNTGSELWASDGTTEGTRLIDIVPGSVGTSPASLLATDSLLFFTAETFGDFGRELYVYEPQECQPDSSSINVTICQGETVDINGTTYSESGAYEQVLQTTDGCDSTVTILLEVNELPVIDLGGDLTINENDSLEIEAQGTFSSYLWSDGTMEPTLSLIASDYGVGIHEVFVEVTNASGCVASDTMVITVEPVSSIDGVNQAPDWSVLLHPNPVDKNTVFQLQINGLSRPLEEIRLEWFDVRGKQLSYQIIENIQVDSRISLTAPAHAGVYFLKLSDRAKRFVSKKVVVE